MCVCVCVYLKKISNNFSLVRNSLRPNRKKKYCRLVGNNEVAILKYFRNEFSALKLTCLTSINKSSFRLHGHKTLPFSVRF